MKKLMTALIVILVIFFVGCKENATTPSTLEPKYQSENNVYTLDVYLDAESDSLSVTGEIYFKNDDYDLEELYITLYPNAASVFDESYRVNIDNITINESEYDYQVTGSDNTQIYIDLDFTLLKGERVTINFEYEFGYWTDGRIADYSDEYLTMYFYPFVAVYDDEGWNIDSYTFRGESYYNTLGDYYVSINTPSSYAVAASGRLTSTSNLSARKEFNYEILNARDFSFSASEDYFIYTKDIEGRTYEVYTLLELTNVIEIEVFNIIEDAFSVLETEIGTYPYNHFTLELGHYFGMESTGIVYCSSDIDEGTIVHEIIHQWFYSMVGNDQSDESFIDEAITTYLASMYYYDQSGVNGYYGYLAFRDSLQVRFIERYNLCLGESLLRKVDELGEQYAYLIYYHGPTIFRYFVDEFMEGDIDAFYDILQVYFNEYKYKIATLDGLLDIIEQESGIENTKEWFMMQITEFQDLDNRPI